MYNFRFRTYTLIIENMESWAVDGLWWKGWWWWCILPKKSFSGWVVVIELWDDGGIKVGPSCFAQIPVREGGVHQSNSFSTHQPSQNLGTLEKGRSLPTMKVFYPGWVLHSCARDRNSFKNFGHEYTTKLSRWGSAVEFRMDFDRIRVVLSHLKLVG